MATELGTIEAIYRFPVKSMRGEPLDAAALGWHGIAGDRRFAFRRLEERGGFPWLSAGRLPALINYAPLRNDGGNHDGNSEAPPTHVRTPAGEDLPIFSDALAAEITRLHGAPVQMMQLKHGIFDDGILSVITSDTVREIGRLAGTSADIRRFRPNVVVRSVSAIPFEEDEWVGGTLVFGDTPDAPAIAVTQRDQRCVMINFDPDGGPASPELFKTVVRERQNLAGVYGTVSRSGRLAVGQKIYLRR